VVLNRKAVEVNRAAEGRPSCLHRVTHVIDQRKHDALPGKDKNKFLSVYSGYDMHVSKNDYFKLGAKCAH
jgi:hypothetical protein